MSKPAITDITAGQQGWDTTLNDNNAVLRDGPLPIKSYANVGSLPAASSNDECLAITADTNTLWMSDGTNWQAIARFGAGGFGAFGGIKAVAEQLALTGASTSTSGQVPKGAHRLGAVAYVNTLITSGDGATSWSMGDSADVDMFAAGKAFTAGVTVAKGDWTADPFEWMTAAEGVTITPDSGTFSGGNVTVVQFYIDYEVPTS